MTAGMTTGMTTVTHPALRYHGAKFRLAAWILRFFPAHRVYTEAFGGGAGVLLQKPRAYAEVYNDLDGEVANFFRVLRDAQLAPRLLAQLALTPYARTEFDASGEPAADAVEAARRTAVRAAMGFGSAGASGGSTGFRVGTARSGGTAQHVWAKYPATLAPVIARLQGVLIENRPATCVLAQHDSSATLHYVDPPYVHSTRALQKARKVYRHEMTDGEHAGLFAVLRGLSGMVVLSGYASGLYAGQLPGWSAYRTRACISSGRGGSGLRTEVLWLNPACQAALNRADGGLFGGTQ